MTFYNWFLPKKPLAAGALSRDEPDAEFMKGIESLKAGKGYSADEVDAMLSWPLSRTAYNCGMGAMGFHGNAVPSGGRDVEHIIQTGIE